MGMAADASGQELHCVATQPAQYPPLKYSCLIVDGSVVV